jgi:hypothetical protein
MQSGWRRVFKAALRWVSLLRHGQAIDSVDRVSNDTIICRLDPGEQVFAQIFIFDNQP